MSRYQVFFPYVALLALTAAAYFPLRQNEFIDFDDELYITANPHVLLGLSWSGFCWAWTTFDGIYWQPISWLSLQLDAQLSFCLTQAGQVGVAPAVFHADGLFWHLANVLLLFHICYLLTAARGRSFLVAALFGVHPLHVESVAWAAERKDVLSVFFGLVTLWAYLHYLKHPGWRRYSLLAGAFSLSLLCKPMLMTLPFVLLLLDYWPLRRLNFGPSELPTRKQATQTSPSFSRLLLEKLPLLALSAGSAIVTMTGRAESGKLVPFSLLPLSARLANAVSGYGWYLYHTFVPTNLAILYQHPGLNWSVFSVVGGTVALAAISLVSWRQSRQRPWLLMGWLWFVGTLLPVIGLSQAGEQAWADRFTYWPHIGLFLAIVWELEELIQRDIVAPRIAIPACAVMLVCFAALAAVQVTYWRDTETLWERALAVTENNHRAHLNLGKVKLAQGKLTEAEFHLTQAVRIHPEVIEAHITFGLVLLSQGKGDAAAAALEEAAKLNPDQPAIWRLLALARMEQGKFGQAVDCFGKASKLRPLSARDLYSLALAQEALGQIAESVRTNRQAWDLATLSGDAGLVQVLQEHFRHLENR